MKTAVLALCAILSIGSIGCMKTTNVTPPVGPPSPNIGVLVALNSLALGCEIASADVDPAVAAYLNGPCPAAATGIINVVEANGTVAKVQALIDTLKAEAVGIPSTAKGIELVNQIIAAAQGVLNIYEEVSGQTVTSSTPPPGASQLFATAKPKAQKIKWTASDKARIAVLKAKLTARK